MNARYRILLAGSLALLGMNACFGPTSTIAYRRDADNVHTSTSATFTLKPDRVYRAALHALESADDVIITRRDDRNRMIDAAKNFQNISITVRPQGNGSQITIVSDPGITVSPNTDESIITMQEVCSELGAPCRIQNQ